MSSILTNMSAMTALQNLAATQSALASTQSQISSGLRVADAKDNAAYWSISTTMKSDVSALSSVTDALNLGGSVVSTATAAVDATLTIMNKLKADLVTAQTPGTSASQVQTDIVAQQKSLLDILSAASFNGVNLLDGSQGANPTSIVASFARSTSGGVSSSNIGTISIATQSAAGTTGGTALTGTNGILAAAIATTTANGTAGTSTTGATGASGTYDATSILAFQITSSTSAADLTTLSTAIDSAINSITAAGAALGTASTQISNQSTFVTALSDAITSGVGSLVDADMNEASTRLNALQTQQQLGVQSLSIANQNSQLILKLFQ